MVLQSLRAISTKSVYWRDVKLGTSTSTTRALNLHPNLRNLMNPLRGIFTKSILKCEVHLIFLEGNNLDWHFRHYVDSKKCLKRRLPTRNMKFFRARNLHLEYVLFSATCLSRRHGNAIGYSVRK